MVSQANEHKTWRFTLGETIKKNKNRIHVGRFVLVSVLACGIFR